MAFSHIISKGEKPMEAWGTLWTANRTWGRSWSQFFQSVSMAFFSICFSILLNRSINPSVWGWYTDVQSGLTWRSLMTRGV